MDIVLTEHARYKLQTRPTSATKVREAVDLALRDRSKMTPVAGTADTFSISVDGGLRIVVKIEGSQVTIMTVIQ